MNNNTTANVLCTKYKVSAFDDILRCLTHYCAPTNEMKSQVSAEEDILHSGIVRSPGKCEPRSEQVRRN